MNKLLIAFALSAQLLLAGCNQMRLYMRDAPGDFSTASTAASTGLTSPGVLISTPIANAYINSSNDQAVVIGGQCSDDGQSVAVTVVGSSTLTSSVICASGLWTTTMDFSALSDGSITITADHQNLLGNSATTANVQVLKDTLSPLAVSTWSLSPASGSVSTDQEPFFSGSAEGASTVRIYGDSSCTAVNLVATKTVSGSGNLNPNPSDTFTQQSAVLVDGAYAFYSTVTDIAGNVSSCSSTGLTYTVDTTPPSAPTTISLTTPSISPGNNSQPIFTVTSSSLPAQVTTLSLFDNATCSGSPVGTSTPVSGSTSTTVQVSSPLANSITAKNYYAKFSDSAGNSSNCFGSASYQYDSLSPLAVLSWSMTPASGSTSNVSTPTITGSAEGLSTVELFRDSACTLSVGSVVVSGSGNANPNPNASFTKVTSILPDGTHTFYHTVTDIAGNQLGCQSTGLTYTLNTSGPSAPTSIALLTPVITPNKIARPTFRVFSSPLASNVSKVHVYANASCTAGTSLGNATVVSGATQSDVQLAANLFDSTAAADYYANFVDTAGNASNCVGSASYHYDSKTPVAVTSWTMVPASGSISNNPTPEISGSGEGAATVELFSNSFCSTSIGAITISGSGNTNPNPAAAFSKVTSTLSNGTYTFYYKITDIAGNVRSCASTGLSYTVDLTPPTPPTSIVRNTPVAQYGTVAKPTFRVNSASLPASVVGVYVYNDSSCTAGSHVGYAAGVSGATSTNVQLTADLSNQTASADYYANFKDNADNYSTCVGPASYQFDNVAPLAVSSWSMSPVSGSEAALNIVTFNGSAEGASKIEVYADSVCTVLVGSKTNTGSGNLNPNANVSFNMNSVSLGAGSYAFYYRITDISGNATSCATTGLTYIMNPSMNFAPTGITLTTPATSPSNVSTPTFTVSSATIPSYVLTASVYSNQTCSGTPLGTVPVGTGDTTTAVQLTSALPNQTSASTYYADFYYTNGLKSSCIGSASYQHDSLVPVAVTGWSMNPSNGSVSSNGNPVFSGSGEGAASVALYSDNTCSTSIGTTAISGSGDANPNANASFTLNSSTLSNGGYSFYYIITDVAGNPSGCTSTGLGYTVGTGTAVLAPIAITLSNPLTSPNTVSNPSFTLASAALPASVTTASVYNAAGCSPGALVGIAGTSAGATSTVVTLSSSLSNATTSTSYYADFTDNTGARSACVGAAAYQYDNLAPLAVTGWSMDPSSGSTSNDPTPTISGSGERVATVSFFTDAACTTGVGSVTIAGSGNSNPNANTTFSKTLNALIDGAYTFHYKISDVAGNSTACASTGMSYTLETVAPTVTIATAVNPTVRSSAIPVTVTFSESVSGFTATDLIVTNGTLSNFAGSGTTYTFDLSPASASAQASMTLSVDAGIANDSAGNGNTAATNLVVNYYPAPSSLTGTSPSNDATPDVTVGNGTNGLTAYLYSDAGCSAALGSSAMTGSTVTITSGAISGNTTYYARFFDGTNYSACSTANFSYILDSAQPTVTIATAVNPTVKSSAIPVTVTFSEAVTGFAANELTVTNGTLSNFAGSGTTYTFDLDPASTTAVTSMVLSLTGGVATDASGNSNVAASNYTIVFYPRPSSLTGTSPSNDTTPAVTVGTGANGLTANLYTDPTCSLPTWKGSAAMSGSTVVVDSGIISANTTYYATFSDAANESACSTANFAYVLDNSAPTVTLTTPLNPTVKSSAIPVTVTFNESVTDFVSGDLSVTNGTITNFAGSGTTYTFDLAPSSATASASMVVSLGAGVATDSSGNGNTAATNLTVQYYPAPSSLTGTSPSNSTTPTVTVGNGASGLTAYLYGDSSCSVSLGSAAMAGSTVAVTSTTIASNTTYYAKFGDGTNYSACSTANFPYVLDTVQPTVSITTTHNPTVKTSAIPITVTFSKSVSGFTAEELTVSNGTLSNFSGSGTTYTFDLAPSSTTAQQTMELSLVAGVAQDSSGNGNTAATNLTVGFYPAPSSLTGTTPSNDTTPTVTVGNGASGLTARIYADSSCSLLSLKGSASMTGSTVGVNSSTISANTTFYATFYDGANESACSSANFAYTLDAVVPTVTITTAVNPTVKTSAIPVTVTFSESVSGFTAGALTVMNGTLSNFAGSGTTYTFNLAPTLNTVQTNMVLSVAAGVATDAVGNANTAANDLTVAFYPAPSSLTGTTPSNDTTPDVTVGNGATGLTASIYSDSGCSVLKGSQAMTGSTAIITSSAILGSTTYYAKFSDGTNESSCSNASFGYVLDATAPTVTIATAVNPTVKTNAIPITVTFSESVTGFTADDLSVTNGTLSGFAGSGTTYTVDLTPSATTAQTNMVLSLGAGVATDGVGNGNTAASNLTVAFYPAPSSLTGTTPSNDPTPDVTIGNGTTGLTATLYSDASCTTSKGSESMSGSTVTITSSTISANTTYYAKFSDGTNQSACSTSNFAYTLDNAAPTVTIATAVNPTVKTSAIPVTVTFSKSVTGFIADDLTVTSGTLTNFSGSGTTYTFDLAPSSTSAQTNMVLSLASGVATDAVGNANVAATNLTVAFYPAPSTVTGISPSNDSTPDVTVGNGVSGLTASIYSDPGCATPSLLGSQAMTGTTQVVTSSVIGTSTTYYANFSDGTNFSACSTANFAYTLNGVNPTVAITTTVNPTVKSSAIPITVTFSKTVTGFNSNELMVTNGTLSNFAGSGSTYTFDLSPSSSSTQTAMVLSLNSNVAVDAFGNPNDAASNLTVQFYPAPSTLTGTSPSSDTTPDVTIGNGTSGLTAYLYSDSGCSTAKGSAAMSGATAVVTSTAISSSTTYYAKFFDGTYYSACSSADFAYTLDNSAPTVTIATAVNPTVKTSAIPITVTFSEAVTGFIAGDLAVTNGTLSNFAGSGTTYTFDLAPSSTTTQTAIGLSLVADVATDSVGNGNIAASDLTVQFYPAPAALTGTTPSNDTTPNVIIGNGAAGLTAYLYDDSSCTNSVGSQAMSGSTTTITSTMIMGNTTYYAKFSDGSNYSACSTSYFAYTLDATAPTVTITTTINPTVKSSAIPVTVTFSESVTGFDPGDLAATNGTLSYIGGSGTTYTFNLAPSSVSSQSNMVLSIVAGIATDDSGNANVAASNLTVAYFPAPSTLTGVSPASDTTPTVTVGNGASGLTAKIYSDSSCSLVALMGSAAMSGSTVAIDSSTISSNTTYYAKFNDGSNDSACSTASFAYTLDSSAPTVTITTTVNPTVKSSAIPITVTFSETVSGFDTGDLTVTNGTLSNFAGSGTTYTFDLAPSSTTAQTDMVLSVVSGVAQDASNNGNTAAPNLTVAFYPAPSTLTGMTPSGDTTPDVTLGNGVSGLTAYLYSDSGCTTAKGSAVMSGATVAVTSTTISASTTYYSKFFDGTNYSACSTSNFAYTLDNSAPTVTITTAVNPTVKSSAIPITVTFSETVTGFAAGELTVTNGTLSNFAGSGTTYTFDLTPSSTTAQTDMVLSLVSDVAIDSSNNGNSAATELTVSFYPKPATLTGTSPSNDTTPDVTIGNGANGLTAYLYSDSGCTTAKGSAVMSGATVAVTSTAISSSTTYYSNFFDGTNYSACSTASFAYNFDNTAPTVTITTTVNPTVKSNSIPVTVTFSESVTGLIAGELTVTNGTLSNFAGSGSSYTFELAPSSTTAQTSMVLSLAGGVAIDSSGNFNTAASNLTVEFYPVPSTLTGTTPSNDSTPDVTVGNGASGLTASLYTDPGCALPSFKNSAVMSGATVVVTSSAISANTTYYANFSDGTNTSGCSTANFAYNYDGSAPTVAITSTNTSNPTTQAVIPMTVTFSESVVNFISGDITVSGGSISNFTGSGSSYSFDLTVDSNATGTLTVDVAGSVAQDSTGNANAAATQYTKVFYSKTPTVSGTTPTNDTTPDLTVGNMITGLNANIYSDATCSTSKGTAVSTGTSKAVTSSSIAGNTNFYADVTDAQGNKSTCSSVFALTLDTVAPAVAITSPANNSYLNSSVNRSSFTVSGTCDETSRTVTVVADSTTTVGTPTCNGATFALTNANLSAWTDGAHTLTATITDLAGNSTTSAVVTVTLDTVAPDSSTAMAWTAAGTITNTTSLTASWTKSASADLNSQSIQFYTGSTCDTVSGSTIALSSSIETRAFTGTNGSSYSYRITSIDTAGNSTLSVCSGAMTVDTTTPFSSTSLGWNGATSPSATTSLTASWTKSTSLDVASQKILFYSDNICGTQVGSLTDVGSASAQTYPFTAPSSGDFTFEVVSVDAAGNQSVSSCSPAMTVTLPPVALSPYNFTYPAGKADSITFTASGGSGAYTYSIDSGAGTIDGSTGVYTGGSSRVPGTTTVVKVTDGAGATKTTTITHGAMVTNGSVLASATDGNGNIYLGGAFTAVNMDYAGGFMPVSTTTGAINNYGFTSGFSAGAVINAILVNGGFIYIGGSFNSYRGTTVQNLVKINATTGDLDTTFTQTTGPNDAVYALAMNGSDLYVGGLFTGYRGSTATTAYYLVKLNTSTGVMDTGFTSRFYTGTGNGVFALAIANSGLYVGGKFQGYGGGTSGNTAVRVDLATGAGLNNLNNYPGNSGTVHSIAVVGTSVILGGAFTCWRTSTLTCDSSLRYVVKIDVSGSTHTVNTTFAYGSTKYPNNVVRALATSSDGNSVFAGGDFNTIGADSKGTYLAKLNATSGALDTASFNSNVIAAGSAVSSLLVNGSDLYVGGSFTAYRSSSLGASLIKVDSTTGVMDTSNFNTVTNGSNGTINAIAISDSTAYVGGSFTHYRGTSVQNLAKFNLTNWGLDSTFTQSTGASSSVRSIVVSGSSVYIGGDFTTYRGDDKGYRLAKLDATNGNLDTAGFNTTSSSGPGNGGVFAMLINGNDLYIAGSFTTYRGNSKGTRIAKLDATTGVMDVTNFNTTGSSGPDNTVYAMAFNSTKTRIYLGGAFTTYRSSAYGYYACAVNATTGAIDTTVLGLSGSPNGAVNTIAVYGTTVYMGGNFTQFNASPKGAYLVKLNGTGAMDATFNSTNSNNGPGAYVNGIAVSLDGSYLYIGGAFTTYKTNTRGYYLAKVSTSNAALETTNFNVNVNTGPNAIINTVQLSSDGSKIYVGGTHTTYRGAATAPYISSVNTTDGSLSY